MRQCYWRIHARINDQPHIGNRSRDGNYKNGMLYNEFGYIEKRSLFFQYPINSSALVAKKKSFSNEPKIKCNGMIEVKRKRRHGYNTFYHIYYS